MLADFDGYDLNCFDLETLRRRRVLTADDEAVVELFRQVHPNNFGLKYNSLHDRLILTEGSNENDIYSGKATERLLQIIAESPLCVPIERERAPFYFAEGEASVEGRLCCKASMSFALVDAMEAEGGER